MGDLLGKRPEIRMFSFPWLKGSDQLLRASGCVLRIFISALAIPIFFVASVTTSFAMEFVVPGGPIITLQDGQRINGHIVEIDQTNIIILTEEGSEETLPRATINHLLFETVTGDEISGALLGWKPGVYELTTEEAVVAVYSVTPPRPDANESGGESANSVADIKDEPVVPVLTERGINGAVSKSEIETESDVVASTTASDLEIDISVESTREDAGPVGFNIELSQPSENSVVLIYATIDDTAIDGEDYEAARGVLVIEAGQTEARIEAPIIDDDISEKEEQLRLFLTVDPAVAVVKNREIIATIEDDDQNED